MVMENEIRLGDIMDKLTPSDRVVISLVRICRRIGRKGAALDFLQGDR